MNLNNEWLAQFEHCRAPVTISPEENQEESYNLYNCIAAVWKLFYILYQELHIWYDGEYR